MSMSGPNCPKCGAASQNPSASQCSYCGSALSAPQPPGQYGAPPQQYGGPQPPVFHSGPQVQPFGGANYGQNFHRPNGFMSAIGSVGNAMFWIRLAIAVVVLFVFAMGSCINALTHGY